MAAELATMAEVSMLGAMATLAPALARLRLPVGAGLRPLGDGAAAGAVAGVLAALALGVAAAGAVAAFGGDWVAVDLVDDDLAAGAFAGAAFAAVAGLALAVVVVDFARLGAAFISLVAGLGLPLAVATALAFFEAVAVLLLAAVVSFLATACLLVSRRWRSESGAFIPALSDATASGRGVMEILLGILSFLKTTRI